MLDVIKILKRHFTFFISFTLFTQTTHPSAPDRHLSKFGTKCSEQVEIFVHYWLVAMATSKILQN